MLGYGLPQPRYKAGPIKHIERIERIGHSDVDAGGDKPAASECGGYQHDAAVSVQRAEYRPSYDGH